MNSGKVILGALAGIAVGAIIGILYAPDKGSESRNKIIKKGEDYLDSIKGRFNSLLDAITGQFNGGRVDVSDMSDSRKHNSKEAKREMQSSAG